MASPTVEVRVVIADDEPLARRGIRQLLATHRDVTVVGEARTGVEAVTAVRTLRPNLLFLDVQMPELDGFGVLRELGTAEIPAVIFVTAYDDFAVRAFEENALDYLVKPVEEARFAKALDRTRNRLTSADALAMSEKLAALFALRQPESSYSTPTRSTGSKRMTITRRCTRVDGVISFESRCRRWSGGSMSNNSCVRTGRRSSTLNAFENCASRPSPLVKPCWCCATARASPSAGAGASRWPAR